MAEEPRIASLSVSSKNFLVDYNIKSNVVPFLSPFELKKQTGIA